MKKLKKQTELYSESEKIGYKLSDLPLSEIKDLSKVLNFDFKIIKLPENCDNYKVKRLTFRRITVIIDNKKNKNKVLEAFIG